MSQKWGHARMEFLALETEIKKRIQNGCSVRSVHEDLQKENRIKMGLSAFYAYCRKSNFVVGSNIDPETLQRFRLTPEEEEEKRQDEEMLEIARRAKIKG